MKTKKIILTCIFLLSWYFGFSQFTVSGIITDEDGKPIEAANIFVKSNSEIATVSNSKGKYSLSGIPSDTLTLIVTGIGMKNTEEKINHRKKIDVTLLFETLIVVDTLYEVVNEVVVEEVFDSEYLMDYEESSAFGSKRDMSTKSAPSTTAGDYRSYEYTEGFTETVEDKSKGTDVTGESSSTNSNIRSGMLTAGEVHDFSKWDLWTDITEDQLSQYKNLWQIYPVNRYCVQLTSEDGKPLIDSYVELKSKDGSTLWATHTDNTGKAELWSGLFEKDIDEEGIYISVNNQKKIFSIENPKKFHEGINILSVKSDCEIPTMVDICFVVDATGSMSDEISYLKVELQDIIEKAGTEHPDLTFNLGSVFYRDNGDAYLTIKSDLSSEISKTVDFIKAQSAGGGGDFPEAVDAGLEVAINELTWSENAIAKVCFLVLDAPPHDNQQVKDNLEKITIEAASKGIRIIPVTCSGIDKSTEYLMRSLALATNGTYVFLTDDSGIGGSHIKPTTDKYEVEYLNGLILRLINQYVLTPTCDNQLPISEEDIQDTSFVVIEDVEPILDVNLINEDSTDVDISDIDVNIEPDTTNQDTDITDIDQPYDYSMGIKYYPNPTTDVLNIELVGEIKELYLADNSGKLLERYVIDDEDRLQLNLGSYPSGMYFIQYLNKDKWKAGQIVLIRN